MEQNPFSDPNNLFPVEANAEAKESVAPEPTAPPKTFEANKEMEQKHAALTKLEQKDLADPMAEIEAALDGTSLETNETVEANESQETNEVVEKNEPSEDLIDPVQQHTEVTGDQGNVIIPFIDEEISYMRNVSDALTTATDNEIAEEMPPGMSQSAYKSSLFTAAAYDA